jgi:hypothetical protein
MRVLTVVAGLAILLATLVSAAPPAGNTPPEKERDGKLDLALRSPDAFFFTEEGMSKTDSSFDLVVTSARDVQGNAHSVPVRAGSVRIFRADAGKDGFTQQGGWYWRCGATQGRSQFQQPGALIMVVRQQDGTVHWYALQIDFRC